MEYKYPPTKVWKTVDELVAMDAKASLAYAFMFSCERNQRWQDECPLYKTGIITKIIDEKYMNVRISGMGENVKCRTDYMTCDTAAFSEDDVVVVKFENCNKSEPVVVGFWNEPKGCFWELWNGPELCATEANRWTVIGVYPDWPAYTTICPELPLDKSWHNGVTGNNNTQLIQINNKILNIKLDVEPYVFRDSQYSFMWIYTDIPINAPSHKIKIKILANCNPIDDNPYRNTYGSIDLREKVSGEIVSLIVCKADWTPTGNCVFIGDAGGIEQIIDLTTYGFDGSYGLEKVAITVDGGEGNHVYMDIDYIGFS